MARHPASERAPIALTVAGSDSGGGAGIQADLKTFHACGVFGTSAVTCLTAQNPARVSGVWPVPPAVVAAQIDRVCEAFPVGAAKTGMLYDAAIIRAVADRVRHHRLRRLVVDPVMVATSGAMLLQPAAVTALTRQLLPLAAVVTPNLSELEVLANRPVRSAAALRDAARALADRFGVPVLAKGGHLPVRGWVVDVLADGRTVHEFRSRHLRNIRPHGAGCTFSAAITAYLAQGQDLVAAVTQARRLITRALRTALAVGRYRALHV